MGNRFTARKMVAATGSAAGSVALSQGTALLTDRVLLAGQSLLPIQSAPVPLTHGLDFLLKGAGSLGLLTGATAGLGIASGALWGNKPLEVDGLTWWKKLAVKPVAELYNTGIRFREETSEARLQNSADRRFLLGAGAGYRIGRRIGASAGQVQGAITGGVLGWRLSGEARALLESALQGLELPPIAKPFLPLLVGTVSVAAGQMLGGAVGGALGGWSGGILVGAATGAYCAAHPERSYTDTSGSD